MRRILYLIVIILFSCSGKEIKDESLFSLNEEMEDNISELVTQENDDLFNLYELEKRIYPETLRGEISIESIKDIETYKILQAGLWVFSNSNTEIRFDMNSTYRFSGGFGIGLLWESVYKITEDDIILFRPQVIPQLNKDIVESYYNIFFPEDSNGLRSDSILLTLDRDYIDFYNFGRLSNENLYFRSSYGSPTNEIYNLDNYDVIKDTFYIVTKVNTNLRTSPTLDSEKIVLDAVIYQFDLASINIINNKKFDYLLPNRIFNVDAITVQKDTIGDLTGPWYRIGIMHDPESSVEYGWLFAPLVEIIDRSDRELVQDYNNELYNQLQRMGIVE